jgi:hypothetical protein
MIAYLSFEETPPGLLLLAIQLFDSCLLVAARQEEQMVAVVAVVAVDLLTHH